jgi:predicted aconitase with swiveling domain
MRVIVPGDVEGEVLYTEQPISFYGGVDLRTGIIIQKGHELEGKSIAGKIFVFPHGVGSTVGSYVLYGLKKYNVAPLAIINQETETIIATGAILANIPCFDLVDIKTLKNAKRIRIKNRVLEILEI